jgi:hypothetical protein
MSYVRYLCTDDTITASTHTNISTGTHINISMLCLKVAQWWWTPSRISPTPRSRFTKQCLQCCPKNRFRFTAISHDPLQRRRFATSDRSLWTCNVTVTPRRIDDIVSRNHAIYSRLQHVATPDASVINVILYIIHSRLKSSLQQRPMCCEDGWLVAGPQYRYLILFMLYQVYVTLTLSLILTHFIVKFILGAYHYCT